MGNYLKGNKTGEVYKQVLSVGAAADRAGLTASLKPVWTDDGGSSANLAPFQLSTAALLMNTDLPLQFRDTGIYLKSTTNGQLDIVADVTVAVATPTFDVNATTAVTIDTNETSNGVRIGTATSGSPVVVGHNTSETTIQDNLTVGGTTTLSDHTTLTTNKELRFTDGNEYIKGDGTDITMVAGGDINLTPANDVNIAVNKGLTFGHASTQKIEGDGTNLEAISGGALTLTAGAASTWKTTAGAITIDSEAAALTLDGHGGVNIAGTNGSEVDVTTTGALDLNSGAFTLDASTMSIDGTDDSNITVTGSGKDLTLQVAGGGSQQLILASAGTGGDSLVISSTAGGIDITSSGGAGDDIDISADRSINISATENVADAIVLNATAGGIDILASSASAGEDIDIIATGSSVNVTSTENAANAIYLRANGGTSETIKIHADQSTADKAIEIIADAGGIDIQAGLTSYGIKIGDDTSGVPILLGHSTSEVTVGDNLTVTGTLTTGTFAPSVITLSHGTDPILTIDNAEHAGGDGEGHCTIIFKGEDDTGDEVAQRAKIIAAHDGSSDDEKGYIGFYTNAGSEGTSPSVALTLHADNTAVLTGDTKLSGTKKLHLGDDTYLHEVSADKLDIVVGAQTIIEVTEGGGGASDSVAIQALNKLYLDGGGNTYIHESASDVVQMVVGGATVFELDAVSIFSMSNNDAGADNTLFGANAGDAIQSGGDDNTCVGDDAGTAITTGSNNTCIGSAAGKTGSTMAQVTAVGYSAGKVTTGSGTFIGAYAGNGNTSGIDNCFIGRSAGNAVTDGDYNCGVGQYALFQSTTASYNTALGYQALYDSNRTADVNAYNTAVGYQAGANVSTSQYNTIVGGKAADALTTGSNNTVIGYNAEPNAVGATNQTLIGYDCQGIGDNYAVIGDGNTTRVYAADDVGATLYAGSATVQTSDKRIKTNVKDLNFGLEYLNKLRPVSFNKKQPAEYPKVLKDKIYKNGRTPRVLDESEIKLTRVGFIAQEVEKVEKEMDIMSDIVVKDDDTGLMNIAYANLVAPIIQAIQELSKRVEELEKN